MIEKAGSGIGRIRRLVKERKLKVKFEVGDFFRIVFLRPQLNAPEKAGEITQKTTQKIIELIKLNPHISRKQIAEKIGGISEDGVKYNLAKLIREGIFKRVGNNLQGG